MLRLPRTSGGEEGERVATIAVDFDGMLCQNAYPRIGLPNWPVIHELLRRQESGDKIILWTSRGGFELRAAVEWCEGKGLRFDAVNRKVFADEYWDDKAVLVRNGTIERKL